MAFIFPHQHVAGVACGLHTYDMNGERNIGGGKGGEERRGRKGGKKKGRKKKEGTPEGTSLLQPLNLPYTQRAHGKNQGMHFFQ